MLSALSLQSENHLPDPKILQESFYNLPFDPYVKGDFRQRRFSQFLFDLEHKTLAQLSHKPFFQNSQYNPLLGNVERNYSELESEVANSEALRQLVNDFIDSCGFSTKEVEVGVHQIRISCSSSSLGKPAPEGIHQDGYEFVGIYCVDRRNVEGGITELYKAKGSKPFFLMALNPGDFLVFNDEQFYHFTTPVKPITDEQGFRDVFVLTAKRTD